MTETTVLRTQADLERLWGELMEPCGCGCRGLAAFVVDAHDHPIEKVCLVDDRPRKVDRGIAENVAGWLRCLLLDLCPDGSVAVAIFRPGGSHVTAEDRSWARHLALAADAIGIRWRPMHVISGVGVHVVAPDDLGLRP